MTVAQARPHDYWISKIQGMLIVPAIVQFIHLWQAVHAAPQLTDQPDRFPWKLTANGIYSAKSAYRDFFMGARFRQSMEIFFGVAGLP
jgi:hypothetical protein